MRTVGSILALLLMTVLAPVATAADAPEIDAETGLIVAPGHLAVRANCGACHGLELVVAQRGDRAFWLNLIRWMQATQNLWPLAEATEAEILDYLATHYGAVEAGRRAPLPPDLRPPVR